MVIHTLENYTLESLVAVFNEAFGDYILPLQMSVPALRDKIISEHILLKYSVGVSDGKRLVAFIFTGIDSKNNQLLSYNAGTGVIPEFRGQHLPQKMYDFLLPILGQNNITTHHLEVITENKKALTIYENIGYQVTKKVACFKGKINEPKLAFHYNVFEFDFLSESAIQSFWNHQPTYQNTLSSILRNKNSHTFLGVFSENGLLAYLIYANTNGRIKQFGVDPKYRNQGLGHQLFYQVQKNHPTQDLSLINIDTRDSATLAFLQKIGFSLTVEQFEMVLLT